MQGLDGQNNFETICPILVDESGIHLRNDWSLKVFGGPVASGVRQVITTHEKPEQESGFDYQFGLEHVPSLTIFFDIKSRECEKLLEKHLGEKILTIILREYQEATQGREVLLGIMPPAIHDQVINSFAEDLATYPWA